MTTLFDIGYRLHRLYRLYRLHGMRIEREQGAHWTGNPGPHSLQA